MRVAGLKLMTIGLMLVACAAFSHGWSQDAEKKQSAEKSAPVKPGAAEMKRLGFYVGNWTYTETYPKSAMVPQGATNTGVYTSKWGPGGNSLLNTFHSKGPAGDFEGMLVLTWDMAEQKYKMYVFGDGFPGAIVETGGFEGDKLVFRGELPTSGVSIKLRNATWLEASGKLISEQYVSSNGAPEKLLVRVEASRQ
jgi:hypothetical protein